MQEEIEKLRTYQPARTCLDVILEEPTASSGNYNIDPNLGSPRDAMKSFCDFDGPTPKTCVENSTTDSQLKYLHLLHAHVVQSIHLPCSVQGPLRLVNDVSMLTSISQVISIKFLQLVAI